jgi:class 3 adenylate cyclase/predicted ATPase
MPDVASWLTQMGLGKHIETFTKNEVDWEALQLLSDDDLKEMGLPLGPRRKIFEALAVHRASSEKSHSSRSQAERRQLTVLFVDLVGSTELSQKLDPEEMRDLIGSFQHAVTSEIIRYSGYVAKLMGDGILAYFGWPRGQENDAERAVRAGMASAAAVANLRRPEGQSLAARIGIATGLVVVGDMIGQGAAQEEAVVGQSPNLAARLQSLARPGTVLVSHTTRTLVRKTFDLENLGLKDIKGFSAPVQVWRVLGEKGPYARLEELQEASGPIVGREHELGQLEELWRRAIDGNGQVVDIRGEAGIGKSRLLAAFRQRLTKHPHAELRYFCSPYHVNSSLHPVLVQIEQAAGWVADDSIETKLRKLREFLQAPDPIATVPLIAEALSLDYRGHYPPLKLTPQLLKTRTLEALVADVRRRADREPVLMCIEDAHWIDPTTREWLELLVKHLAQARAFLIMTARPEYQSPWSGVANATSLHLDRLAMKEVKALIDNVAAGTALPSEASQLILDKSEGVPLFIEELTKAFLDTGILVERQGDMATQSFSLLAVPSTLQESLVARLDKLPSAKDIAQTAACIGRTFQQRLLAAVTGSSRPQLAAALSQLEGAGIIFRNGAGVDASYTFKHALIQETAYQTLLKSRRAEIHAAIAKALEAHFPELAEIEPEILGYHYTAAGVPDTAASYWLKAGRKALMRSGNPEAIALLKRGLGLIKNLSENEARLRLEIELQTSLGVALMGSKGYGSPDVLEAFSQARRSSEKLDDDTQLFKALCGEASYYMISGNLRASDALGQRAMEIARKSGDQALLLEAHHRQWATKFFMGDYAASNLHTAFGLSTYDPDVHHQLAYIYTGHDPGTCCRNYSAYVLWLGGHADQALERSLEAVAMAERVGHPLSLSQSLMSKSAIHMWRGETREARECCDRTFDLCRKYGFPLSKSEGRFQSGWAIAEGGDPRAGVIELRAGIESMRATGAAMGMPHFLAILAWALGETGEIVEGLATAEEALSIAAQTGANYDLPEVLRIKAELLLRQSKEAEAESQLKQAITAARADGSRSSELRASMSLARVHRSHGRLAAAQKLLRPIYESFTEGFGTRDLRHAAELLSEIS